MTRVTMIVPEGLVAAANELAACLGYSAADRMTFTLAPRYQDAKGALYAVASSVVREAFLTDALAPLNVPPWGADKELAALAQSRVLLSEEGALDGTEASSAHILAILGDDSQGICGTLGLSSCDGSST